MKFDITKLIQLVGIGMSVAESIKNARGKAKETVAIQQVQEKVPMIEEVFGLDFVNDAKLHELLSAYITARVALSNGVAAAKGLNPHSEPPQ